MTIVSMAKLLLPATGALAAGALVWQASGAGTKLPFKAGKAETQSAKPEATERVIAEGRVVTYPGAEVTLGTEVAGTIVRLPVQEKSVVRRGDLIVELRADDLRASLTEARARIAEADADIRHCDREMRRTERLLAPHAGTQQDFDSWCHNLEMARARKEAAAAVAARLEATIAKTVVVAPIDGVVTSRLVHPGETVETGTRLVTIVDLSRLRVEAEVDEFDTGRIYLGTDVAITAEGYQDAVWRGKVEEIPDSVVGRRIKPEDPSRPTDTRVLLVKVIFQEANPLKLGQRVELTFSAPTNR
jgi:RND family efflux transporter MFP subunit